MHCDSTSKLDLRPMHRRMLSVGEFNGVSDPTENFIATML